MSLNDISEYNNKNDSRSYLVWCKIKVKKKKNTLKYKNDKILMWKKNVNGVI